MFAVFSPWWEGALMRSTFGYNQGVTQVSPRRIYEPYSIRVNNSFKMKRFVTFPQLREPAATTSKWGGACASGAGSTGLADVRRIFLIRPERVSLPLQFERDVFISVTQWQSCKSRAIRDGNVKKGETRPQCTITPRWSSKVWQHRLGVFSVVLAREYGGWNSRYVERYRGMCDGSCHCIQWLISEIVKFDVFILMVWQFYLYESIWNGEINKYREVCRIVRKVL